MSNDFTTFPVEDARIQHIKDNLPFAVLAGAGQNTMQSFPSNSASTTSIIFNVQVPIMSTVIDREVLLLQSTIQFTITCANVPVGNIIAMDYAQTDATSSISIIQFINIIHHYYIISGTIKITPPQLVTFQVY